MNHVFLSGRLTRDPEIRQPRNGQGTAMAIFGFAVQRNVSRAKQSNGQEADFFQVMAFGKGASFCEKYLHKGTKINISGHLVSGSYTNKEGIKIPTVTVIMDEQEFCEYKGAESRLTNNNAENGGAAQNARSDVRNAAGRAEKPLPENDTPRRRKADSKPQTPSERIDEIPEGRFSSIPDDFYSSLPFN